MDSGNGDSDNDSSSDLRQVVEVSSHKTLKAVGEEMDIVPWTWKDRLVQYVILFFVLLNAIGVIVGVIWGL